MKDNNSEVKYIYERNGNTVYSREFGAAPETRIKVEELTDDGFYKSIAEKYFLEVEWAEILRAAPENPALQQAIERVKIIYHLGKKDGKE